MSDVGELRDARDRASRAEARAAELALAMEVLDRLAGVTSEASVAATVLDVAHLLLGAGRARLVVLDRRGEPMRGWERLGAGDVVEHGDLEANPFAADPVTGRAPDPDGDITVSIGGRHGPLARLEVAELPIALDVGRHDETLQTIARVAAMALASVRAMHGIVPICLEFKRIRDEAGQWHRLEAWISSHSDARLSHGLCPDCLGVAMLEADSQAAGG